MKITKPSVMVAGKPWLPKANCGNCTICPTDRAETQDLAQQQPDKLKALTSRWEAITEEMKRVTDGGKK